ncbi:anti-phage-associated DUF3780 domain-containing protein [Variovorax sp. J31P207]|uniref:anti-phage-associated DUF3780 domain-containing protein n=1 Tax=Variovorax sp. J31P207 TaxID=3053510 RepID=UPI002578AE63|nr:anti-phage-associated DUF3780 domain-containing protein [Variovorax sp. J31P207]MDM0068789.1 DUF3780 domain-containing protein [Variovorax sp. J31P207]
MTASSAKKKTVGFGAPDDFGAHVFRVEIPAAKEGEVRIIEDYGVKGGEQGRPYDEVRAVLPREIWSAVSESCRRDFNDRLKTHKMLTGRWQAGSTKVDRLLGKELCVLAWAAEHASKDERKVVCAKWSALRPEERWWLFSQTVSEAGLADDAHRGWRKALYFALSDGVAPELAKKRPRRPEEDSSADSLPLFQNA